MSELKPCPFCGGDAKEEEYEFCVRIVCQECYSESRSIESWNTRSEKLSAWDVVRRIRSELKKHFSSCDGIHTVEEDYDYITEHEIDELLNKIESEIGGEG